MNDKHIPATLASFWRSAKRTIINHHLVEINFFAVNHLVVAIFHDELHIITCSQSN